MAPRFALDPVRVSNRAFAGLTLARRRALMRRGSERFLTATEVCGVVGVPAAAIPEGVDPDRPLSLITAWPVGVLRGSMFVHLEEDPESLCDEAIRSGASLVLSQRQIKDHPCLIVPDTTDAYVRLCANLKRQTPARTIAVTGSIGKTTTKEMLAEVYRQHFRSVFVNPDNSNMYYMIGHYTQLLPGGCERYIQECHEGDFGSASTISRMIEPDIAIVTNIGDSHAARFGTTDNLIREVAAITAGMHVNGTVVYSLDCQNSRKADFQRAVVSVGVHNNEADYVAEDVASDEGGIRFRVRSREGTETVELGITGEHNVYSALLVWAAARLDGVPTETIAAGLRAYRAHGVRQNVVRAGSKVIHVDCYNAAPQSMASALARLSSQPTPRPGGSRIAVLGNMEELGPQSVEQHREVGALVARSPIDVLITCGDKAADIADRAREGTSKVIHTTELRSLVAALRREAKPGDAVLLKASHSMHFDRALLGAFPAVYARHILVDQAHSVMRRFAIAVRQ